MKLESIRKWRWYTWLLIILPGGLIILAAAYILLRVGGVLTKFVPSSKKWIEYDV